MGLESASSSEDVIGALQYNYMQINACYMEYNTGHVYTKRLFRRSEVDIYRFGITP